MIKTIITVAVPFVLGVALGIGATSWEFNIKGDYFVDVRHAGRIGTTDSEDETYAKGRVKVINGESHDFGVMDPSSTGRHTFQIRNEGDGPLMIGLLQTTCTCTSSDLEEGESVTLGPGETKDVTLEWTIKGSSQSFSQSAILQCSDPERRMIRLVVEGRVHSSLSLFPETIVFTDFSNKGAVTEFLRVCSYERDNLQCERVQQLKPELEEYFEIEVSPLDKSQVAEIEDCKSGLLVKVTAKTGLPLGPFRQTVSLTTNLESDPSIDFEIEGNAVGDLSVWTTEKFNQRKQILDLGLVKRGTKRKAEFQIFVKGDHKDTTITLDQNSIEPAEILKATLGAPVAMGKSARRFPLIIEVDAGDHAVSRLARDNENYGKIVLKTTHPDAPEIVIRVAFATGG